MGIELIERMETSETSLRVIINDHIDDHILDDFFVEYDAGIDLRELDPSLQIIPFILNVLPVVWVSGKDYTIDTLDATLLQALPVIKQEFIRLFPMLSWNGTLHVRRPVDNTLTLPPPSADASSAEYGTLFSGGIDSVYTVLKHIHHPQRLITVWGNDITLANEEGWRLTRARSIEFGDIFSLKNSFVKSNLRDFLNRSQLNSLSPDIPTWWGGIQHGMGFVGIAAPLLSYHRCQGLLIASSHTSVYQRGWGSHPAIENNIRWEHLAVVHHGYDASRQEKVRFIVDFREQRRLPALPLRVCYAKPKKRKGDNCMYCEKCLRSQLSLLMENRETACYGFTLSENTVLTTIRKKIQATRLPMRPGQLFFWTDLQQRARQVLEQPELATTRPALASFLNWLITVDLPQYRERYVKKSHFEDSCKMWRRRTLQRLKRVFSRSSSHSSATDNVRLTVEE